MREYRKNVLEYADVQDACITAKEDGFAEGEAIGEARGRMETARKIAFEMLCEGVPIPMISKFTSLSEDEILSLNE